MLHYFILLENYVDIQYISIIEFNWAKLRFQVTEKILETIKRIP